MFWVKTVILISWAKESTLVNKVRNTEVKSLLYWEDWCWSIAAKKLVVIKIQHHWGKIFWKVFPWGQYREAVFQRWPKCTTHWQLNLICVRFTHVILALMAWRGHKEELTLGTDCVAGLESLKSVQERLLLNVQPSCIKRFQHFRDVGTVVRSIIKNCSNRSEVKPAQAWRTSCVCCKGQSQKCDPSLWRIPEDHGWIPNIGHWVIYTVRLWFCRYLTVSHLWKKVFPLEESI